MATKTPAGSALQAALSELRNPKKDNLRIGAFDPDTHNKPVGLPTGNISIDTVSGIGGFPRGRITELVGPPSSGKTTAALQCAARVQQAGGIVAFLDYEQALDPEYALALGLDIYDEESFVYMKPEYFEQGANAFRKAQTLSDGAIDLVIHDSVAAMTTKHELEAATGAVQVADRAKMLYQYSRQLNALLSRTDCGAIFLNHLLEKVDTSPMGQKMARQGIKQKISPGGNALPYYASMRMEFKQVGTLRTDEMDLLHNEEVATIRQIKSQVTVIKNKVADPWRTAELRVRFGRGFSQEFSVLQILVNHKVIKKNGAWFEFKDETLRLDDDHVKVQGEDAVLKRMEENPDWFKKLEEVARTIVDKAGQDAFDLTNEDEYESEAPTEIPPTDVALADL